MTAYVGLAGYLLIAEEVEWAPPSVEEAVAKIEGVAAGRITERNSRSGSERRNGGRNG